MPEVSADKKGLVKCLNEGKFRVHLVFHKKDHWIIATG